MLRSLSSPAAGNISGPFSRLMLGLVIAFVLAGISGVFSLKWLIRRDIQQGAADNYAKFVAYQVGNLAGELESPDYLEFGLSGISDILTPAMRLEGIVGIQIINNAGEVIMEKTNDPKTAGTTLGGYPILFNNRPLGRVCVSLAFPFVRDSWDSLGYMTTANLATLTARNYGALISSQLAKLHRELSEPDYWEFEVNKFILILSNAMRLDGISGIKILDKNGDGIAEKWLKTEENYGTGIQTDIVYNNNTIGKVQVFIDFPGIRKITRSFQMLFVISLFFMGIVLYFLPVRVVKRLERSILTLNNGLESEVATRTAQLIETNKQLQTELIHRKKLETSLVQSEKMSAVGQLAAGVAHEINNPLSIILGFAQSVVKRIKNKDDPLTLPLMTIEREAARCGDLVRNLLVFSRSSESSQAGDLDLNAAVEGAISMILARTKMCQVELAMELGADLPKVHANKNQIQQIVVNLANNAIDAMPKGGTLTVRTALSGGRPGHVEIQVRDTGGGIPKEIRKKIFDPFFTTKEVGKGTGLGLSLVYEIAHKHGGTVELESEEGKGAQFTVFLPVRAATPEASV